MTKQQAKKTPNPTMWLLTHIGVSHINIILILFHILHSCKFSFEATLLLILLALKLIFHTFFLLPHAALQCMYNELCFGLTYLCLASGILLDELVLHDT